MTRPPTLRRWRVDAGLAVVALAVLALAVALAQTGDGFAPLREQDGVRLDAREQPARGYREYRGATTTPAGLDDVMAVLADVDVAEEWMGRCHDVERLEQRTSRVSVIYQVTDAPWPLADRDVVLRMRTRRERGDRARLDFAETTSPARPPVDGLVRMPRVRGHYLVESLGDGAGCRIEYQLAADPGGRVPESFASAVTERMVVETLRNLRERLADRLAR